jgi:hypothetical protein
VESSRTSRLEKEDEMAPIIQNWNWSGETRFPNDSAQQIAVAENKDGRVEIFYVGTNNDLYHNWETLPGGTDWFGETRFPNDSAKQIAVGQNADGRLEIFYVGTNNGLYHNWQTSPSSTTWAGETSFSNDSAQQIAVAQNKDGRLEIFYVGTNNDLYHNWQTSPGSTDWFGETRFPGDSAQQVAVGQNTDGRLEIFYVGTNNDLYHNWQTKPSGSTAWFGETRFPGDSAQQVAVGQNQDGRLEIFYVGTNDDLYHNWQTTPSTTDWFWAGETRFPGDSAKQVTVVQNQDGRLETFYVGTNNDVYHNWQVDPNSTEWAGEFKFPGDSAKQIAAGLNSDGRLEIFYVGTNNDLYHNWQISPGGGWTNNETGDPVTVPLAGLGSNSNYILYSDCGPLTDLAITIEVTEDIVWQSSGGGSLTGFGFQLNGYSPSGQLTAWQQYIIALINGNIIGAIENWPVSGGDLIYAKFNLVIEMPILNVMIPAGYRLRILLQDNEAGYITGAYYAVIDNNGNTVGSQTQTISSSGGHPNDIAPMIAFELNLVGPANGESAVLSSGAGTIIYEASSLLTVLKKEPPCAESSQVTGETTNSFYSTMTPGPSNILAQNFSVSSGTPMIRKEGKNRHEFSYKPGAK